MAKVDEIIIDQSMRFIARALAARRLNTISSGVDNLPTEGPALVVARHYHYLFDGLALFAAVPRQFHILVTLDWVQSKSSKLFMQALTGFARWPVVLRRNALIRSSSCAASKSASLFSLGDVIPYQRKALRQAVELLVKGRVLVVFPEGYPNIDPRYTLKLKPEEFLPFRFGFVSIMTAAEKRLGARLPIIPLGIRYDVGKPWVARLVFGKALYRDQFANSTGLVEFAQKEVKRLSGLTVCSAEST